MTPDQIVGLATNFIASLGFPIFVAVYLLIYQKRSTDALEKAIRDLDLAIHALLDHLEDKPPAP